MVKRLLVCGVVAVMGVALAAQAPANRPASAVGCLGAHRLGSWGRGFEGDGEEI